MFCGGVVGGEIKIVVVVVVVVVVVSGTVLSKMGSCLSPQVYQVFLV